MTRRGTARSVLRGDWQGRRDNGRAFLRAAEDLMELAQSGRRCNPIITQCVDAAIAYGDAVSIRFGGVHNTADHHALGKTIRRVIGARFHDRAAKHLADILAEKDEAAYGAHAATQGEGRAVLKAAQRFAEWAEQELARPG